MNTRTSEESRRRRASALFVLLAVLGISISIAGLLAPATFRFDWGELSLRAKPDLPGGDIALDLGPVGYLAWKVHSAPISVEANFLVSSDLRRLPETSDLANLPLRWALTKIPFLLLGGALAGGLVGWAWGRRVPLAAAAGAGIWLVAMLSTMLLAALTFSPGGMEDPKYRGPVKDVPRVLHIVRTVTSDFKNLRDNISRLVAGLQRIQSQVASSPSDPLPENMIRILVVADLHNNPVGLLIGKELATRFGVDGILDAGDFTDQGTDLEGEIFSNVSSVQVPYVIAAGNHEDEAALAKVREIPSVVVLDAESGTDLAEIAGLKVLGDRDPMSSEGSSDPFSDKSEREIPIRCARLADRFAKEKPDIVVVHRRDIGQCAADQAVASGEPLVFVWAHLHKQSYEEAPFLVAVSPGTSGANGVKAPKDAPYGFSLLDFDRTSRMLVSTCQFQFDGPNSLRLAGCHLSPKYLGDQESS